jgi:DNA-directed RNA polymerase specialized sigma24 family protein
MAEELQCRFANWFRHENARWERAAYRYLGDYPLLIDDAVQEGWIRGSRLLQNQESRVAELWHNSQSGNEQAVDHLRGLMFRVVRNAAYDLLKKELRP